MDVKKLKKTCFVVLIIYSLLTTCLAFVFYTDRSNWIEMYLRTNEYYQNYEYKLEKQIKDLKEEINQLSGKDIHQI